MRHLVKINENVSSDNPEIRKVLVRMAELVTSDANGSSVHPCEEFDAFNLYELAFGTEKFAEIINVGLDNFFEKYEENNAKLPSAYEIMSFNIHPDTLSIETDWRKAKGFISFHSIGTSIGMENLGELNKFALYSDSLIKFQRLKDALRVSR